ncbi:hypothetical protein CAPTEDRAFT_187212 [Capitella teleta]|uniref:EGF-like domain-containing protein n=1 Tax=Capitella teleta TaxID=283909 RepID=R7V9R3_CAPTE|nr:hypothetical protein CAPTEDRAFT_187212 [Capitella teleta]|eukprot:ELU15227.1 hypothetical protein CAPTEDRAFT_187212 [Capitella teleta]
MVRVKACGIIVIALLAVHVTGVLGDPLLVWTQRSHKWTKIRGIEGDPSNWLEADYVMSFVSSKPEDGFRYCISYDHVRSHVYWTETHAYSIVRQPLNDTLLSTPTESKETIYVDLTSNITATAVDWLAGNVYFTDAANQVIGVATWNAHQQNMHRILFSFDLNGPHGIAVDPHKGYLFWSDVGPMPRIERSSLTGTDRMILVSSDLQHPLGMVTDIAESRVYWNYLFISNEKKLQIQVFNKSNGVRIKLLDIDALTYHITMAQDIPTDPSHPCMTLGCDHLCFNRGDQSGVCTCMQGYYLELDGKTCTRIGVDWLANKVYWTDQELYHIMVFELDGRYHSILLDKLSQPGALSVDSVHRDLFWTDYSRDQAVIWRSALDGTDATIIIDSDVISLTGLVTDPRSQRIYWTDNSHGHIESANYAGRYRRPISSHKGNRIYDVTVFQDYMTWTAGEQSLQFSHLQTGDKITNVNPNEMAQYNDSYDVVTYDVYLQPVYTTPCNDNKGQCQHHCYPISMENYTCGCAIGFSLAADNSSCSSDPTNSLFILYVDPYHKQVYQQSILEPMDVNPQGLNLPAMDHPVSVDFDQTESRIYWIDHEQGVIKGSALDGSESRVLRWIGSDSRPLRLVVDSASRHLFFTDEVQSGVFRIDLPDGRGHKKVAEGSDLDSLAADPIQGRVYYTSGNSVWFVERDGGTATKILDIEGPTALSMRPMEQVLYIGLRNGSLLSMETNETDSGIALVAHLPDTHVYAVAAGSADVYITAWNQKGVHRVNLLSGGEATLVSLPVFARLTDIKIFENIIPLPVVTTPPDMTTIGIVLGVILLILLLALIFGLLLCRGRKKAKTPGSASSGEELYDEEVDSSVDMGFSNGIANGASKNYEGVYTEPVNGSHPSFDPPSSFDPPPSNGDFFPALAAAGIVVSSGVKTIDKKKFKKKAAGAPPPPPKSHKPRPTSSSEFELTEDKKVATVIQRLATRLRHRLSSVRFSGTVLPPDIENGDPEPVPDYQPPPTKEKVHRNIDIPDKPHKMPRGYAPASHNVPRDVRTTWGKAKGNAELNRNADLGNKFGMQI